jgi:two-component system nitrogen regulation response regulator NtrX
MALDILVVDDEADIRMLVADILEDEGYSCRVAGDSDSALMAVEERLPGLVVLDIWLRGSALDGLAILEHLMRAHPALPVVMISGHGTIETAVAAIKMGAYDFIEKPFKADRLLLMVKRAIDAARLMRENAELRLRTGAEWAMIGESQTMSQVRAAIDRVAPTQSRVLITGPPGAGKEAAARRIHENSARGDAPFIVLNCATMSPDRMEAELFGTEHGADGGRAVGTFEQAHGGSLLLDEVADMPLETQGKIVRVLQDQTFHRVGGATAVSVDVRVLATSSRDLDLEMSEGRFRQDLFYRLSVVPIAIPPLIARRDDIPELVRHFVARSAEAAGIQPRVIAEDAIAALQVYPWPGNVRQLRNVVDWILIMAPGEAEDAVRADMLPPEIISGTPDPIGLDNGGEVMGLPLREAREIFERQYLVAQVDRFGGNISRTASFVGMERSALHRKLKSLGVAPGDTRAETRPETRAENGATERSA